MKEHIVGIYIENFVELSSNQYEPFEYWPVGAMVARGPPKAKVVGSSPISVVDNLFAIG